MSVDQKALQGHFFPIKNMRRSKPPGKEGKLRFFESRILTWLLLLLPMAFVTWMACDPKKGYVMHEGALWTFNYLTNADYTAFKLDTTWAEDLKKIAWWESRIDGGQFRLLTALFQLLDAKLITHFQFYTPLVPNFSFSWILSLLVIPGIIFQTIRHQIGGKSVHAGLATACYLVSPAVIGSVWQNYHPGKVLALTFFSSTVLLTMQIETRYSKGLTVPHLHFVFLSMLLFFGMFTDGYAFISFISLPLLAPKLSLWQFFSRRDERPDIRLIVSAVSAGLLYLCFVYVLLPPLFQSLEEPVSFMHGLNTSGGVVTPRLELLSLKFYETFLLHCYWFVTGTLGLLDGVFPIFLRNYKTFQPKMMEFDRSLTSLTTLIAFALVLTGLMKWLLSRTIQQNVRGKLAKMVLLTGATVMWIQYIHSFLGPYHPWLTYFYGCIFILPFCLSIGAGLARISEMKSKKIEAASILLLIGLLPSMYQTSSNLNGDHRKNRIGNMELTNRVYSDFSFDWRSAKSNPKYFQSGNCKIETYVSNAMRTLTRNDLAGSSYPLLTAAAVEPVFVSRYLLSSFCQPTGDPASSH